MLTLSSEKNAKILDEHKLNTDVRIEIELCSLYALRLQSYCSRNAVEMHSALLCVPHNIGHHRVAGNKPVVEYPCASAAIVIE